mmetsp:Transcript_5770/g.12610  ORF Transcript_5770/g.12610 Transcript_5770/m.12610 type:complete len:226 (+) Transcript_5770:339-1016(+)
MDHNSIRFVDRKGWTHISSLHLHTLAVDNLARRNGRVEYHPTFRTAVKNNRLQFARDLDRHVLTFVNVHLLLRIGYRNLAHAVLTGILGLILDIPLATPRLVFAFRRPQRFLGTEFGCSRRFRSGGGGLRWRIAGFFELFPPGLLIPRHLFETRRGGVAGACFFLLQFSEYVASATCCWHLCRRWSRLRLRCTPALPNFSLRKVLPARIPSQSRQMILLQISTQI